MVGEAKWSTALDARRPLADLEEKVAWLVDDPTTLRYAVCARERITNAPREVLTVTAQDIFPTPHAE
jgi:hypothetical protein